MLEKPDSVQSYISNPNYARDPVKLSVEANMPKKRVYGTRKSWKLIPKKV